MVREKCIGSFLEALEAQELGAERVELCDNLTERRKLLHLMEQ